LKKALRPCLRKPNSAGKRCLRRSKSGKEKLSPRRPKGEKFGFPSEVQSAGKNAMPDSVAECEKEKEGARQSLGKPFSFFPSKKKRPE